jgi:quercetin dioxygenase-like cupin family protein/uncharacterized protein YndB with AHSA1/START domain
VLQTGETLDMPQVGIRGVVRKTAAETGGEYVEIDVIGRPRGFLAQSHVHVRQTERHEVISGLMRLVLGDREHVLHPGEAMEVPPGTPHRQLAAGDGPSHVRVQMRPAGNIEGFLEYVATISREGGLTRTGWLKPGAAARLVQRFGDEGHAAQPPLPVQKALAAVILGAERGAGKVRAAAADELAFVDEWDVHAPAEAVFDTVADATTFPHWWRPVFLESTADGPPGVGTVAHQRFKGRLPYHLKVRGVTTRYEPPRLVEGEFEGDLKGTGTWTLTPIPDGTHVRFEWRVLIERPLLRRLAPVLRPAYRFNHAWSIARAQEGLEPYALGRRPSA